MENVKGLARSSYLDEVCERLAGMGYEVSADVLDAADFGVPQNRERLFVVGTLNTPSRFWFPDPTVDEPTPCGEVLGAEPVGDPASAAITWAKNPVVRGSPHSGMLLNGGGRPLDPDAPAPTIPASAGGNNTPVVDPVGVVAEYWRHLVGGGEPRSGEVEGSVRRLSARECARLQGFPDDFEFEGSDTSRFRQIGNAVPPAVAEALGGAVLEALSGAADPPGTLAWLG